MRIRLQQVNRYALAALILAALFAFLIMPLVLTVSGGFTTPDGQWTLRYLLATFRNPQIIEGLGNSLLVASCTTLLCIVMALPLAVLATRYTFPGQRILTSMLLVPLILPPFVGAIGLRAMLGRFGAVNSLLASVGILDPNQPGIDFLGGAVGGRFWGVIIMEALHLYPIMYLNISAALANLDPTLDEAAQTVGASRWTRFWRVTFPLILPGVFAGTTLVFIWSFTELGTPLMFDFNTITPVQVFWGIQEMAASPQPYALVVVMLGVAVLLYLLGRWAMGGHAYEMKGKASVASVQRPLGARLGWLTSIAFGSVILLAVLPHIGVVLTSFSTDGAWYRSVLPQSWTLEHYENALTHGLSAGAIRNSLFYSIGAMTLALGVGVSIAYLVVRARIRGGWLLDSLAMLPLAVPGLVMAFGYVALSLRWPFKPGDPLAGWLDVVGKNPNPALLLMIAYAVRRLPYVVRSVAAGLEQTAGELEEAAYSVGASTPRVLSRIVLPLIMANVLAGAILAFSFSMLEVSDSLVLAQKDVHYPITKAIFELYNRLGDGPYVASALGVWGMALLTVTLVGASIMIGKRLGAIFRA